MNTYKSPFSWRYGSQAMREIWSLENTRLLWRKLWVTLAEIQVDYQLVSVDQVRELKEYQDQLDLARSHEIEDQIHHDLMAELKVYAEQCQGAGGVIHLGATSMDIKDNTLVLQQKESIGIILNKIQELLLLLANGIEKYAELPLIGYTHLQPAEPSTLGYRLSQYGQDLLEVFQHLSQFATEIRGKGFTGAVGSSASFAALIGEDNLAEFQEKISQKLGLSFFGVVSQTYPRLQDFHLLSILAGMGAVLYKFAFDLRILQSPAWGELAEPFADSQVGSSAMPFKRNPIKAEKINSLGRQLAQLPRIAWDNAAHSLLERTLDDSANQRIVIPEAFLISDELLSTVIEILEGLVVNTEAIAKNLADFGVFAGTEKLLMDLVKVGADRQRMHEIIRGHAMNSWLGVQRGEINPLSDLLSNDQELLSFLDEDHIRRCLTETAYLGDSSSRSLAMAAKIRNRVNT